MSRFFIDEEEVQALTAAGFSKEEISIVVHNLDKLLSANKLNKEDIKIVVHNLVKDVNFKREFLRDPVSAIGKTGVNPKTG